jgi:hypothetical protein
LPDTTSEASAHAHKIIVEPTQPGLAHGEYDRFRSMKPALHQRASFTCKLIVRLLIHHQPL